MVNFLRATGFEGLHGRPVPVATGAKLANKDLHVIVITGDGDCLGEGLNHFIQAIRGNHKITCIIHDNQLYALTKGQASPTSTKGYKTPSTPSGVIEEPVNPLTLGISTGATFVARAFSGDIFHLTDVIVEGIQHNGFSIIDVFQPCVTYNKINTYEFFRERVYKLDANNHQVKDKMEAYKKALEIDKLPIGIFYKEDKPTYEDQLPQIKDTPLVKQNINKIDISPLMNELR